MFIRYSSEIGLIDENEISFMFECRITVTDGEGDVKRVGEVYSFLIIGKGTPGRVGFSTSPRFRSTKT